MPKVPGTAGPFCERFRYPARPPGTRGEGTDCLGCPTAVPSPSAFFFGPSSPVVPLSPRAVTRGLRPGGSVCYYAPTSWVGTAMKLCTAPPGCIRDAFGGPEQCARGLGVPHEFDSSEKFIFGQKFIFTRCMLPCTYGAWVRSICGPGGLLGV